MKRVCLFLALALICALFCGCASDGNKPYEPDGPAPAAHGGRFTSEHGSMSFSGDGESVTVDFDAYLSELTSLPEGEQKGSYVFLSGDLPPNGSVPVRYDAAHEMKITVDGKSAVIELGLAQKDGSGAQSGVGTVTPERIPLLFSENGKNFNVIFIKEGETK